MPGTPQKSYATTWSVDGNSKPLLEHAREWLLPSPSMKRYAWPVALGLAYIGVIAALGGLRSDHVLLGLLGCLDLYNEKTRRFLRTFFPFILTGALYDSMRYYYWQGIRGHIHVAEPYLTDLKWFGIRHQTPNEYFALHSTTFLDLFCGLAYLTYVGEYLLAAFYLFFKERTPLLHVFGWSFFVVNALGFVTYFVYPAAPPWYVSQFGFGPARLDVRPFPAATHRFDQLLGTHFFDQIYSKGVDVFGAYPSLHVAYPLLTAWLVFRVPELRRARAPAIAFFLLMCFSAIYLQHHYVVDVLLGIAYAISALLLTQRLFTPPESGDRDPCNLASRS